MNYLYRIYKSQVVTEETTVMKEAEELLDTRGVVKY